MFFNQNVQPFLITKKPMVPSVTKIISIPVVKLVKSSAKS